MSFYGNKGNNNNYPIQRSGSAYGAYGAGYNNNNNSYKQAYGNNGNGYKPNYGVPQQMGPKDTIPHAVDPTTGKTEKKYYEAIFRVSGKDIYEAGDRGLPLCMNAIPVQNQNFQGRISNMVDIKKFSIRGRVQSTAACKVNVQAKLMYNYVNTDVPSVTDAIADPAIMDETFVTKRALLSDGFKPTHDNQKCSVVAHWNAEMIPISIYKHPAGLKVGNCADVVFDSEGIRLTTSKFDEQKAKQKKWQHPSQLLSKEWMRPIVCVYPGGGPLVNQAVAQFNKMENIPTHGLWLVLTADTILQNFKANVNVAADYQKAILDQLQACDITVSVRLYYYDVAGQQLFGNAQNLMQTN